MHKIGSLVVLMILGCSKEGQPSLVIPEAGPVAMGETPKPPRREPAQVVRPSDLVEHPEAFVGKVVDVDIVEPLDGPTSADQIARLEYGYYTVQIPEGSEVNLYLAPPGYRASDPNRYKAKFDHVIEPPVRVRGEVSRDDESRPTVVVRVESAKPIDLGPPVRVPDASALGGDDRYDRKLVEILGEELHGFERSTIVDVNGQGTRVWVSRAHYRAGSFRPASAPNGHVGILFAKKGARYGHLGGSRYELVEPRASDP